MLEIKELTVGCIEGLSLKLECGVLGIVSDDKTLVSSLPNIIAGVSSAERGEIFIDEISIFEDTLAGKRKIGYLPAGAPLYRDMTVFEYLFFIGKAKHVGSEKLYRQIDEVFELLSLGDLKSVLVSKLPDSAQKRLGLAGTLLGNPSVVILDGLFDGMTVTDTADVTSVIKMLGQLKTVVITSSDIREISALCTEILIVSDSCHKLLTPDEVSAEIALLDAKAAFLEEETVEDEEVTE